MNGDSKYRRQSKRQCWSGCIAVNAAILCGAYSFIAAMSDNPGGAIAAAFCGIFAVFIAVIEFKESIRCLQISRRWVRWDREAEQRKEAP